ncbi:helix-turn-helix domain-containing protein [Rhizobium sp. A37_96]
MDNKQLIASLSDIAASINAGHDTETILLQLIQAACRHVGWYRGTIMSIDLASGYAHVTVRHDPTLLPDNAKNDWVLATSPSLIALRRNEPVFIPDAKTSTQFPGFQKESIERDYSSVLVMPMSTTDVLGRPIVLTLAARDAKTLSDDDLALMKLIVQLGAIALEKQKTITEQIRTAEQKQEVLSKHTDWMRQALSDDSVKRLAARIATEFGRPILVLDAATDTLVAEKSPDGRFFSEAEWSELVAGPLAGRIRTLATRSMGTDHPATVELSHSKGVQSFTTVARIHRLSVDDQATGALFVLGDEELSAYEALLVESAKQALSVQLMRSGIRLQFEQRSLDELFSELAFHKWSDENEVIQRALRFGIDLDRNYRLLAVSPGELDTSALLLHRKLAFTVQHHDPGARFITMSGTIIVLVPQEERINFPTKTLIARIIQDVSQHAGREPIVALSDVCRSLRSYPGEFARLSEMLRIAEAIGKRGLVNYELLGPVSMLLASADLTKVRDFLHKRLGQMIHYDSVNATEFVLTLENLVGAGFRNQQCADQMGLHVTTLRYRLGRIAELFQIDLDDPQQRFELELALRISRLVADGTERTAGAARS